MTQSFVLEYPNGREHARTMEVEQELVLGEVIALVGRRWRVDHIREPDRRFNMPRLVCTPLDASPLAKR